MYSEIERAIERYRIALPGQRLARRKELRAARNESLTAEVEAKHPIYKWARLKMGGRGMTSQDYKWFLIGVTVAYILAVAWWLVT